MTANKVNVHRAKVPLCPIISIANSYTYSILHPVERNNPSIKFPAP